MCCGNSGRNEVQWLIGGGGINTATAMHARAEPAEEAHLRDRL